MRESGSAGEHLRAIGQVVRAINRSGGDVAPVYAVVLDAAQQLLEAESAALHRVVDGELEVVAVSANNPVAALKVGARFPLDPRSVVGRAALGRRTVHVPDAHLDPTVSQNAPWTRLGVPVLSGADTHGVIAVAHVEPRPFTPDQIALLETFAQQVAIAIENVRLFNETKESLERQTAISGILRVISGSPTDVEPVLTAIAESAARFTGAEDAAVVLVRDGQLRVVAHHGPILSLLEHPRPDLYWPADRRSVTGRAVVDRRTIHVADIQAEPDSEYSVGKELTRDFPDRTTLATPLMREGQALGALMLRRLEVRPFTEKQIELVETFADQAVIAIENVRLFNETRESLERQTAVSEILRVMAGSPTDVAPVLQAIAESAARFCGAENVSVILEGEDGLLHPLGHVGGLATAVPPFPIDRTTVTGRSMVEGGPVHVHDLQAEAEEFPLGSAQARAMGHRTTLATPLVRAGRAFGAILLRRGEVRPFTDKQVDLVRTFADQAVIAIDNVRLFNETKEALEQQTAVSDVLASIGRSAFDLPTLLGTVVERAARLCHAPHGIIYRLEGGVLRIVAGFEISGELRELNEKSPLTPGDRGSLVGRVTAERRPVRIDDAREDPEYRLHEHQRVGKLRSMLGVPLLRGDDVIGAMSLWRTEPVPFTDAEVAIVTTFADQAAIATENVRLFNETKEALERQTAVSDILKVISASPTDIQPVLDAIASSAARFTGAEDASVLLVRDGVAETRAHHGPITNPFSVPLDRDSVTGAAIIDGRLVHVRDVTEGDDYPISKALSLENDEQRTVLAAPLMRDGRAIGAIVLRRREPQAFSDRQVDLVRVFADQAVIAIENVRLFNQTKEALEQQTAMSDVLATISRSAFDLRTVLHTIAERAVGLATADAALIFRTDDSELVLVARHPAEDSPYVEKFLRLGGRQPIDGPTLPARAVRTLRSHYVEDVRLDPALPQSGTRTRFAVPIQRDGQALGAIVVTRVEVAPFTERQRALVETFADQAAIAIENVRLFNETKEALEQQTATSEVLQAISRSAFDLQVVLDTVVERAAQLCGAEQAWMRRIEGDQFRFAAYYGSSAELRGLFDELRQDGAVTRIDHAGLGGRAVLEKRPIHVHDITADEGLREASLARRGGGRTALAVPMLRDGEPIGAIVVARSRVAPFTDREIRLVETFADQAVIAIENVRLFHEIQEQSRRLEIAGKHKSEFLANMSHELRTPLNAIIGFSEVLLQGMFGPLNEKQREYQQDVLSSGRHLLSLINDILDLAKIEAGRVELELSEFSLQAALENGMTMIRERAARHGIRVDLDVDGVDRVLADERKVKQIVFNLLSNAVKFTGDGGRVDVRASRKDGEIHVAVRDTGIGIDEADRDRIFQEFQQAGRDPERSREGTGLGLALTKRYVELHGGRIWVESEVGRGSTFTFALPVMRHGKEG